MEVVAVLLALELVLPPDDDALWVTDAETEIDALLVAVVEWDPFESVLDAEVDFDAVP